MNWFDLYAEKPTGYWMSEGRLEVKWDMSDARVLREGFKEAIVSAAKELLNTAEELGIDIDREIVYYIIKRYK
jgi:hypothetical protein